MGFAPQKVTVSQLADIRTRKSKARLLRGSINVAPRRHARRKISRRRALPSVPCSRIFLLMLVVLRFLLVIVTTATLV